MTEAIFSLRGVGVTRDGDWLLQGVDWTARAGQRWVLVGPNGAGKTTLLRVVAGYLYPSRGRVELLGRTLGRVDVRTLRRRIGYASAALRALVRDDLSALEVVATAADGMLDPFWVRDGGAERERAAALLERLGCGRLLERAVGSLSTGEQQRVQIARALLPDPDLLLLDEPFAGLDLGGREQLLATLAGLAVEPRPAAIVLVVHHLEEIPPGFEQGLLLAGGRVMAAGPLPTVLADEPVSRAYGSPLQVRRDADGRYQARAARAGTDGRPLRYG